MKYLLDFTVGDGCGDEPAALVAASWKEGVAEGSLQEGHDAKGQADCDTDAVTEDED
jgi:hypothetical protein